MKEVIIRDNVSYSSGVNGSKITNMENKQSLAKQIKSLFAYHGTLMNEILNQPRQPNGRIYLHGEPIWRSTYNNSLKEINILINRYNSLGGKQHPILEFNKYVFDHIPVVQLNNI